LYSDLSLQNELASDAYLEAIIGLLSVHKSLEQWMNVQPKPGSIYEVLQAIVEEKNPTTPITLANISRIIAVKNLEVVLRARHDLFSKFKELDGYKLVMDIFTEASNISVKSVVLGLLMSALKAHPQHKAIIFRLGIMEHLASYAKESNSEEIRTVVLETMKNLTGYFPKQPTNMKLSSMPEEMLQVALSPTESIQNKFHSLISLIAIGLQPAFQECMLKHFEDGATQLLFEQILPITKDMVTNDNQVYPSMQDSIGDSNVLYQLTYKEKNTQSHCVDVFIWH
jgi:hypothetical protein